ncbi:hypothetical protein AAZX31_16G106300 [Glycine max]
MQGASLCSSPSKCSVLLPEDYSWYLHKKKNEIISNYKAYQESYGSFKLTKSQIDLPTASTGLQKRY